MGKARSSASRAEQARFMTVPFEVIRLLGVFFRAARLCGDGKRAQGRFPFPFGKLVLQQKKFKPREREGHMWVLYAFGSALFAGLTAVLAKCGIRKTDSTVATAIRTIVVLIFSWVMVFLVGSQGQIAEIGGKTLLFLILSGLATGGSWLCYYKALQDGPASVVAPIDKLSILVTILFSWLVFHEKLTKKAAIGLVFVVGGTLLMLL